MTVTRNKRVKDVEMIKVPRFLFNKLTKDNKILEAIRKREPKLVEEVERMEL